MHNCRCRLCGEVLQYNDQTLVYSCPGCGALHTFSAPTPAPDTGIHEIMIDAIRRNDILSVRNDLAHGVSANAAVTVQVGLDSYLSSALHEAVATARNYEIAQLLIQYGADVNEVVHLPGEERPLLCCAVLDADSPELVELLLKHGANACCSRFSADGTTIPIKKDAQNRSIQALLQQYDV